MLKRLCLLSAVLLTACSTTPSYSPRTEPARLLNDSLTSSTLTELPDWNEQKLLDSWPGLLQSCRILVKRLGWAEICQQASRLNPQDNVALRQFLESNFTAWKMTDGAEDKGLITGYYEPLLKGSRVQSERTPWPVYGTPQDLITLNIPLASRSDMLLIARRASANRLTVLPGATVPKADEVIVKVADFPIENRAVLKGRLEGNRFLPYYTRADIARLGGVSTAAVLAWVENPVELFFLQVQGSGRIQLEDGSVIRLGYADNNGYGNQSIGRWLIDNGEVAPTEASMQGIQRWLKANLQRQQELFNVNPRYIFFKTMPQADGGPTGTLGIPLTDGYSIAVDPQHIPLGLPVYLSTTWPLSTQPLNRLMYAQDTGNAIRGPVRADFFWGFGDQAAMYAGKMKQPGMLWLLLPNGMTLDSMKKSNLLGAS